MASCLCGIDFSKINRKTLDNAYLTIVYLHAFENYMLKTYNLQRITSNMFK